MSAPTDLQYGRARLVTRPFVLVTAVALIFFVYVGMMVPIVPLFIEGPLDAGEFGIGLTVAVFALTAILARPVVGRIADRYGRRVLMVGGALIAAAGGALSAHAVSLPATPRAARFDGHRRSRCVRRRGHADRRPLAA